jgi:hypothetical protein
MADPVPVSDQIRSVLPLLRPVGCQEVCGAGVGWQSEVVIARETSADSCWFCWPVGSKDKPENLHAKGLCAGCHVLLDDFSDWLHNPDRRMPA